MKQLNFKPPPLIIAHRGAQSHYPEHTIKGYEMAARWGANYIEPDLVLTKDGIFIARHEPYLSQKTNIASLKEFKERKCTKIVDGVPITDWFVSDFTLAELKKLRVRQIWKNRPQEFNDQFEITTFQEIIDFAKAYKKSSGKEVGIYPELKHPTFHRDLGLPMEDLFLDQIAEAGYINKSSKIYVQCFEVKTLQYLSSKTTVGLIQLIGASRIDENGDLRFNNPDGSYNPNGQPYDFFIEKDTRDYSFFTTEKGMKFVASYAHGIGPWKPFVISLATDPKTNHMFHLTTNFVTLAHKNNLKVHPYTFRNEDAQGFSNEDPTQEYLQFFEAGVDGLFTDYTMEATKARDFYISQSKIPLK